LGSSLNLDYLDVLDERIFDGSSSDLSPLLPLLTRGGVRRNLECLGYTIVTFNTGYYWSSWRDSDVFISTTLDELQLLAGVNAFEMMLIRNSAGLLLADSVIIIPNLLEVDIDYPFHEHRERTLFILDALENIAALIESPKFVYAHILPPHPPFIFGPEGEAIKQAGAFTFGDSQMKLTEEERFERYRDQVTFINSRIELAVQEILRVSKTPPIIILQADHGLDGPLASQMAILNAYHLPDGGDQLLYDTISPVNSFRVIFNYYFGSSYDLLDDVSYYSRHADPFDFTLVPNEHVTH